MYSQTLCRFLAVLQRPCRRTKIPRQKTTLNRTTTQSRRTLTTSTSTVGRDIADFIQRETAKTAAYFAGLKKLDSIHRTILEASSRNVNDRNPGPTGQFLYEWIQSGRTYQRTNVYTYKSKVVLDQQVDGTVLNMSLSVNETLLAFFSSSTRKCVCVRDMECGRTVEMDLDEAPVEVEFGQCLDGCSHTLLVVCEDGLGRPHRVLATSFDRSSMTAKNETAPASGSIWKEIFHSPDPAVFVNIHRTKGCNYVAINARTQSSNEVRLVSDKYHSPRLVRAREKDVMYHVEVATDEEVFVLTDQIVPQSNENISNQHGMSVGELSLFQTTVQQIPIMDDWGVCISRPSHSLSNGFVISDFEIFKQFIAYYERSTLDGHCRIRVVNRYLPGDECTVPLPDHHREVATLSPAGNMCYDTNELRFYLETVTTPKMLLVYNMMARELRVDSKDLESSAVAISSYTQRRVLVTSKDGTLVPLSLVYRVDSADDSKQKEIIPVILIGYGAYGRPLDLTFDPSLLALLDSGCAVGFAHIRGGGELGRAWHVAGRGLNKPKGIEDYLACAEALVSGTVLDRPVQLTAKGFSAGGVLVGASVNTRPELFHKVVLTNAFLDVSATMENKSQHLTQHEWDEYGNPLVDEDARLTIESYCPVRNVSERISNTSFLITSALDDKVVPFWNAVRYTKALRQISSSVDIYLYIEPTGGHHFSQNRVKVAAMETAFVLGETTC